MKKCKPKQNKSRKRRSGGNPNSVPNRSPNAEKTSSPAGRPTRVNGGAEKVGPKPTPKNALAPGTKLTYSEAVKSGASTKGSSVDQRAGNQVTAGKQAAKNGVSTEGNQLDQRTLPTAQNEVTVVTQMTPESHLTQTLEELTKLLKVVLENQTGVFYGQRTKGNGRNFKKGEKPFNGGRKQY